MSIAAVEGSVGRTRRVSGRATQLTTVLFCALPLAASTFYVNGNLNPDPPPDGLTWATAFNTVQAGIDAAEPGDEVWVAATNYLENLTLKAGVALYGGFRGDETALGERNWTNHPTVLDGQQAGSVVIVEEGATNTTRIDGFTVQNGSALNGGGIVCSNASPVIRNSRIILNRATGSGGGVFCTNSAARIELNLFESNYGQSSGGAIAGGTGSPIIRSNTIRFNQAGTRGGAIGCAGGEPIIANNLIFENTAHRYGGGIDCVSATATISHNRIIGNHLEGPMVIGGGGVACDGDAAPLVANNLLLANEADPYVLTARGGGAIYCASPSRANLWNNTILWNIGRFGGGIYGESNLVVIANNIIAHGSSGVAAMEGATFRNNCVFGNGTTNFLGMSDATGRDGNLGADPRLSGSLAYPGYHLLPTSPCRDSGGSSLLPAIALDLEGQPRLQGGAVDIGADESDGSVPIEPRTIVRVGPAGDDHNDGSSWSSAKRTLQAAIDATVPGGGEIWVQAGTYDELLTARHFTYLLGGFAGSETLRSARDWKANPTVLDGAQGGSVMAFKWLQQWATVDGFTIRNGLAEQGGGIYCEHSAPTIANNLITENTASNSTLSAEGGGIYCSCASPTVSSNTLSLNRATDGGGICCLRGSAPLVVNNAFLGNQAAQPRTVIGSDHGGGAVFSLRSAPRIFNNFFFANAATNQPRSSTTGFGGALCTVFEVDTRVIGNTFLFNQARNGPGAPIGEHGGGIFCGSSNILVANNLIAYGSSGIRAYSSAAAPLLKNNCVFGNATNNYLMLADPTGTNGNLSVDPLLVNTNGDFHLAPDSPCINAGDDGVVSRAWADLDGQVRVAGQHVDIGADEFGSRLPFTLSLLPGPAGTKPALRLEGEPGRTYVFENSPDFTGWTPFSTNLATNGTVIVEAPAPATAAPQFLRGVTGP